MSTMLRVPMRVLASALVLVLASFPHRALAQDPASRFLNNQLNSALGKKLELLQTAALLPNRT